MRSAIAPRTTGTSSVLIRPGAAASATAQALGLFVSVIYKDCEQKSLSLKRVPEKAGEGKDKPNPLSCLFK